MKNATGGLCPAVEKISCLIMIANWYYFWMHHQALKYNALWNFLYTGVKNPKLVIEKPCDRET